MSLQRFDYAVLALGVCAVSTGAVLVRQAEAPALVIAASRMTLASAPLLAIAAVRRRTVVPRKRERLALSLVAGVCLALHFAFWIASVQQTSIVTSVVLVTASPLFVALASSPLLGERPTAATWLGIAMAACGAAIMVAEDVGGGSDTLLGDLYAVLGAVFVSGYFLAGRSLRASGETWVSYATLGYSVAALVLVALALVAGESFTGYSTETYLYFVLLALVPQLIGHTALNRSLGYLPAVSVTIAVLGEPVGATILGAIFLDEMPTPVEVAGGLLVLLGVYVGLRASLRASRLGAGSGGEPL